MAPHPPTLLTQARRGSERINSTVAQPPTDPRRPTALEALGLASMAPQSVYVLRHAHRFDFQMSRDEWRALATRSTDPSLSERLVRAGSAAGCRRWSVLRAARGPLHRPRALVAVPPLHPDRQPDRAGRGREDQGGAGRLGDPAVVPVQRGTSTVPWWRRSPSQSGRGISHCWIRSTPRVSRPTSSTQGTPGGFRHGPGGLLRSF